MALLSFYLFSGEEGFARLLERYKRNPTDRLEKRMERFLAGKKGPAELTEAEKEELRRNKGYLEDTTIDNNATMTEIIFLARLYNATGEKRYGEGVRRGVEYLLESQYDNGGWPQFYPRNHGYYTHITYNDNAMENVLRAQIFLSVLRTGSLPACIQQEGNGRSAPSLRFLRSVLSLTRS